MGVAVTARAARRQHVANDRDALTPTDHMRACRGNQLAVAVNAAIDPFGNREWWKPCGESQLIEMVQRGGIRRDERNDQ